MQQKQCDFLKVIKSAITGEKYELSDGFDLDGLVGIAKKHRIVPLFYYGIINSNIPSNLPVIQSLFLETCKYISSSERQLHELENLFSAFDEAKIDYMPLKGTLLKKMYPKSEMRTMGDADVLIKAEQ